MTQPVPTPRLGPYEVLGLIGVGGMARVIAVLDPRTGERRAAKRMILPSPAARARFLREARLQRRVDHPNVLPILDVLDVGGHPTLVMPLVEGPSLARLLAEGRLPVEQRLALFRQVVDGVAAIHAAGLVHRDLKPGNVLVDAGVARVADFGLVKSLAADASVLTRTGMVVGTPAYMAPEQRVDARVDARADVWALGALLVELLGGARGSDASGVEGPWGELARAMLAAAPSDRPADAGEVVVRLPPTEDVTPETAEACRRLAPVPHPDPSTWTVEPGEPVRETPRNLPAERDAFVGREEELALLAGHLHDGCRLVSVLGFGGTGKTRLVLRYGWIWLDDWPGGVWFCDLSEARSVDGIAFAVATALDVPLGNDPTVQLGHAIGGRGRCLVILDNFEQVARYGKETLGRWLDRATEAAFVVTTREVLGLPGETTFVLDTMQQDDAVALFAARAVQAKAAFSIDADRVPVLALVRMLDGLPLAIELAAARVGVLSAEGLLARMTERFRVLTLTAGRQGRQATLKATLDWSWDLLSADEQRALAQLSVFEGGFTLEAAEGVLALSAEAWTPDVVQALVDKSFVRRALDDRFDLLVSVQEYAAEKLSLHGELSAAEARVAAETRHGTFFARYGTAEALAALRRAGGAERYRALSDELDNLVATVRRSVARADAALAVPALGAAYGVLGRRGPYGVAVQLATSVLGLPSLLPPMVARASTILASALDDSGRLAEASIHFQTALAAAREVQDRRMEGNLLGLLGMVLHYRGQMEEGRGCKAAALAIAREVGDRTGEGDALANLGDLHKVQGRMDEAQVHFDGALVVFREVGNRRSEGMVLAALGGLYRVRGHMDEARAHFEAALVAARECGDRRAEDVLLYSMGLLHAEQGQPGEARSHYDAALRGVREKGDRRMEGYILGVRGNLHLAQGRWNEARADFDAALAAHREVGSRVVEGAVLGYLGNLHQAQGRPAEARAHYDAALRVAREVGDRRFEGVWSANLAALHLEAGRPAEARAHYDEALAAVREVGDRRLEGVVLGGLGTLHHEEGRPDEARACFQAGQNLLRDVGALDDLGTLLCGRARLEHAERHPEAARRALAEAKALAVQVGAGPDSDLGRTLAAARAAVRLVDL